jgi:hypothetical protein
LDVYARRIRRRGTYHENTKAVILAILVVIFGGHAVVAAQA